MGKTVIIKKERGFTLIELLIVIGMLSMAMMAIYSLYQTHQRSAYVQDEVVEVQQNLRMGMDSLTRDIRMSGCLIPTTDSAGNNRYPVMSANTGSITLLTASPMYSFATINTAQTGMGDFVVDRASSVDPFIKNVDFVTIVRAQNRSLPAGYTGTNFCYFKVTNVDRTVPKITLADVNCASGAIAFKAADVIVKLGKDTAGVVYYPSTITYKIAGGGTCPSNLSCLIRTVNGEDNVIASNMTGTGLGLQLTYVTDNGTPAGADNGTIRAVSVTLAGQTVTTQALSDNVSKQRELVSVISIKNRYGVSPLVY